MNVLRQVPAVLLTGVIAGAAAGAPAQAAPAISYPEMQLINIQSRTCLTPGGAGSVVLRGCTTGTAFRWLFLPQGLTGRFHIENSATRRCLAADPGGVRESACADAATVGWQLKKAAGPGDYVASVRTGKCLTFTASAAGQDTCKDIPARRWTVRIVGGLPLTTITWVRP